MNHTVILLGVLLALMFLVLDRIVREFRSRRGFGLAVVRRKLARRDETRSAAADSRQDAS